MADKKLAVIGAAFVTALLTLCYFDTVTALLILAVLVCAAAALIFVISKREWRSALLRFIGSVFAAVLFFGIFTQINISPLSRFYNQNSHVRGAVYSVNEGDENKRVVIDVLTINGESVYRCKAAVYVELDFEADVDDYVYIRGRVFSFDSDDTAGGWRRYNYSKGVYLSVNEYEIRNLGAREHHTLNYYASNLREDICDIYARYFGGKVLATVEGITLGKTSGMTDAQKVYNQQAGITHAFAVSGMNVTFLAIVLIFFFRLLRIKSEIASAVIIAIIVGFMFLQSFTPSITRAGIMFIVMLVGKIIGRERSTYSAIAFSALMICLANPYAVSDASFQLSYAAVLGIVIFGKGFTEAFLDIFALIKCPAVISGYVSASFGITAAAMLTTAPISISLFGYISPTTFFTNLLALWSIEIVFIAGFLLIPLSFVPGIRIVLAEFIEVNVKYLNFIVEKMGSLSIAELYPQREVLWITFSLIVAILAISILSGKGKKASKKKKLKALKTLIAIVVVIAASLTYTQVAPVSNYSGEELVFSVVSVGQGDCIVISKGDSAIVVDCGSNQGVAAENLRKYITENRIQSIEAIIVSHMHKDHANGVAEIAEYYDVKEIYLPREYDLTSYGKKIDNAVSAECIVVVHDDLVLTDLLDDVTISLYTDHADSYDFTDDDKYNDSGTVVFVDYADSEFLICGDSTVGAEKKLLQMGYELDVDVLKVPHHGSVTSSSEAFLAEVTAEIGVISYGDNSYGLPDPEILERLSIYIPQVYNTYNGTVTIVTVGNGQYEIVR